MQEWAVALILIGISISVASALLALCRMLGGWTWVYAWLTGNKEERAQLATHEQYGGSGYVVYPQPSYPEPDVRPPPFLQPQNFTNDLKSSEVPRPQPSHPVPPLPPPPNDPHHRRLSLDIAKRSSLDSDLPDALAFDVPPGTKLQRAMSCDSVCSDTSVVLETLDSPQRNGEIELALEYSIKTEELIVSVLQARGLQSYDSDSKMDSYVRVCLLPDHSTNMQTAVKRGTDRPEFKERFLFGVIPSELSQRTVQCFIYVCGKYTNTLIGEAELRLAEIDLRDPYKGWISIVDSQQRSKGSGELMFSLSYLPTAERLTVVLVKAKNLVWTEGKETADPFVKVYLLQKGKKISKKKTSIKKNEPNPTFNEAMIFSVPAAALQNIQLRLTMAEHQADGKTPSIGHVFVGPQCGGKSLSHWNQMMSSPRKPTAMWHPLRKRDT